MKAMILAAGRGERMRPLTDALPKPMLKAGGKPLIGYLIEALHTAGVGEIVINHAHLGECIIDYLGNGQDLGVNIIYSAEDEAMDTGGGIRQALPFLGEDPFIVVNGDIWTDFPFIMLPKVLSGLAHLILVANPDHHKQGDFCLKEAHVTLDHGDRLTFSGIAVYTPALFRDLAPGRFPLVPILREAIEAGKVTGEYYPGDWLDIGTPERLRVLQQHLLEKEGGIGT